MILGRQHRRLAVMSNCIRICRCLKTYPSTIRQCGAGRSYSQLSVNSLMAANVSKSTVLSNRLDISEYAIGPETSTAIG